MASVISLSFSPFTFSSILLAEDDFERSEDAAQDYRALIEAWGEYMSFLLNDREENS